MTISTRNLGENPTPDSATGPPTVAQKERNTFLSVYHALNDPESHYVPGSAYSTIRHTRPWVYYQGVSTIVPITILGKNHLSSDRRITLQRRGWRTGLLGWTVGGWLGGTIGKELDVTPQCQGRWDTDLEEKYMLKYDHEIKQFLESSLAPKDHRVLETDLVHIPVASGDGYFRLLIYPSPSSHSYIASTASFRVGSLSLSSAHPRGASVITILLELALKTGSVVIYTGAWASFYAAFPFLKLVQSIPGTSTWGTRALALAYRLVGGQETTAQLKERYQVEERRRKAEKSIYQNVPFGSAGVRTAYDLEEDTKKGKGGMVFRRDGL
ncbi:hypothetical protein H0H81_012552 [Sphagnurus paluster]|uniref:Uncharacterized protein n=1 Tax=Sphagnurus paluster TaxID=117069 RepID=A0A9P7GJB2_9AGAR|nr:hypothetical protein H0H81_012552 [Sphagnurus paluster]